MTDQLTPRERAGTVKSHGKDTSKLERLADEIRSWEEAPGDAMTPRERTLSALANKAVEWRKLYDMGAVDGTEDDYQRAVSNLYHAVKAWEAMTDEDSRH